MADGEAVAVELSSRRIPPPAGISEAARAVLAMPRPAGGAYPALDDADGWRRYSAHPAHDVVRGVMRDLVESTNVVQFYVPG